VPEQAPRPFPEKVVGRQIPPRLFDLLDVLRPTSAMAKVWSSILDAGFASTSEAPQAEPTLSDVGCSRNADMTDAASLVYEPLNEYKPLGPDIGIVDGPLEYLTTAGVRLPLPFSTRMRGAAQKR
jgi:hypothetical protein